MQGFEITRASKEDIAQILELLNAAFEIYFGEGELAFRKAGKRFKNTDFFEEYLDQYYVLKLVPSNDAIVGVCRTQMKNNTKRVEISHLGIDPPFQVCLIKLKK
jgi:ribosomal protein S18 acetylase RimI-like enzyme